MAAAFTWRDLTRDSLVVPRSVGGTNAALAGLGVVKRAVALETLASDDAESVLDVDELANDRCSRDETPLNDFLTINCFI